MQTHDKILDILKELEEEFRKCEFENKFNFNWYYEKIIYPIVEIAYQIKCSASDRQVAKFAEELNLEKDIKEAAQDCKLSAEETQQLLYIYYDFFEACEIKYPSPLNVIKDKLSAISPEKASEFSETYKEMASAFPARERSSQEIKLCNMYRSYITDTYTKIVAEEGCQTLLGIIGKPLTLAMHHNDIDMFKLLLETKAGAINKKTADGRTPIHDAASYGCEKELGLLIEAGANVNPKNNRDKTPLKVAFMERHKGTVNILLKAGAIADFGLIDDLIGDDKEYARLLEINGSYIQLTKQEKEKLKSKYRDVVPQCTDFESLRDFIRNEQNSIDDRITALYGFREVAKLAPSNMPTWVQESIKKFENAKKECYKDKEVNFLPASIEEELLENNNAKYTVPNKGDTKFGAAEDNKRTLINLFLECYGAVPDSSKVSEKKPQSHVNSGIERYSH